MTMSQSLARRAVVAVLLTAGFYLMALAMVGGLVYIPYAEWVYAGRLHPKIALACLVGAGLILWSIMPRWDRFEAPGPQLLEADQPELFRLLRQVAAAAGQPMPAEVYATAEMNAWVMDRGGLLGIGSRRVMSLGLPLLKILTVSEAKAVIAHEFGHFHGGDTKLGPWIFRTRQALLRTVNTLGEQESVLQKPFLWYGRTFMKITQGISRSQEYTADRLAAQVAGASAMKSALTALHLKGGAFDSYWRNEFVPVVQSGFRPPMLEGYAAFIAHPVVAASLQQSLTAEMERGETETFDSHPALRDRLAAIKDGAQGTADQASADSLLRDQDQLERTLLRGLINAEYADNLQPLGWENVVAQVWLPFWRKTTSEIPDLPGAILPQMPDLLQDRPALAKRLTGEEQPTTWSEERDALLSWLLGAATVIALEKCGWRISAMPGEEVTAIAGERRFTPFEKVRKLISGEISHKEWEQLCVEAAVSDVRLVPG